MLIIFNRKKTHLIKIMHRNGCYLPSKNSTIILINWMLDFKEGIGLCQKYVDLKLQPYADRTFKYHFK